MAFRTTILNHTWSDSHSGAPKDTTIRIIGKASMSIHYEDDYLRLQVFVSGFSNNAWLVTSKIKSRKQTRSLIIDTPDDPHELLAATQDTEISAILITHNHQDHLQGFEDVIRAHNVPVGIGAADSPEVEKMGTSPSIDVSDGALIVVGDLELRAIATPGHTPGSTCYYLESTSGESNRGRLFSGDTLFPGGPGRTGSPADLEQIVDSIGKKLLTLPPQTAVHPGHGDDTSVGEAKIEYDVFIARPRPEGLSGDVAWLGG